MLKKPSNNYSFFFLSCFASFFSQVAHTVSSELSNGTAALSQFGHAFIIFYYAANLAARNAETTVLTRARFISDPFKPRGIPSAAPLAVSYLPEF